MVLGGTVRLRFFPSFGSHSGVTFALPVDTGEYKKIEQQKEATNADSNGESGRVLLELAAGHEVPQGTIGRTALILQFRIGLGACGISGSVDGHVRTFGGRLARQRFVRISDAFCGRRGRGGGGGYRCCHRYGCGVRQIWPMRL